MGDNTNGGSKLSSLQRALIAVKDMRSKLEEAEGAQHAPIAIIGMACRFPGLAHDLGGYWNVLQNGIDAARQVPPVRWNIDDYYDPNPDAFGKMYTRNGGFIDNIEEFDAGFFNITPREAVSIDPQHRLLMEVSWEAIENAGIDPTRLINSLTGVFVGISNNEYALIGLGGRDPNRIDAYTGTGTAFSVAAGRLSHFFKLRGPSIAVDTACSSSLVAVDQAVQSLRNNKCHTAIAGGVNLILSPESTIYLCRVHALSKDGRCRSFDALADGYGRGEGCGVIVMRRLCDALADGNRILAVIRGSAINHDGQSSGLTVPNSVAQQEVIKAALSNSKIDPSKVCYIEAHGTGTELGDPIEIRAIASVFADTHSAKRPLRVGTVKTNIGHLEAAAGIAGLIKVVLSFQHGKLVPNLHFDNPSPHIPWDEIPVSIVSEGMLWDGDLEHPVVGISSFGFSGTNAHLIVEKPHAIEQQDPEQRPWHILPLSAKNETALIELAERYQQFFVSEKRLPVGDTCFTAGAGRTHFRHRLAFVAKDLDQLSDKLSLFSQGKTTRGASFESRAIAVRQPKIVFMFTGQGSQYLGMGRELYETQPRFRNIMDECSDRLEHDLKASLVKVLFKDSDSATESNERINQTAFAQPALFALEYALAQLWRSWGIEPHAVLGHSVGEYVAACVAGAIRLEDGLKLVANRGRLIQKLPKSGTMAAVFTGPKGVARILDGFSNRISVAAKNSPANTVISGLKSEVYEAQKRFESEGIHSQLLSVSHAFHSFLIDEIMPDLHEILSTIAISPPRIKFISNLFGRPLKLEEIQDPAYWKRHSRECVRFHDSIKHLNKDGFNTFLEIGPHPVLSGLGQACIGRADNLWLHSLRREASDWQQMLQSLGALYVAGCEVNWKGYDASYSRRIVDLPHYPFQRKKYWWPMASYAQPGPTTPSRPSKSPGARLENVDLSERSGAEDIGSWLFGVKWEKAGHITIKRDSTGLQSKKLVIFADPSGYADALISNLVSYDITCIKVCSGERYEQYSDKSYVIDPESRDDFIWLIESITGNDKESSIGFVYLWSLRYSEREALSIADLEKAYNRLCCSLLYILQAIESKYRTGSDYLYIVTCGAQARKTTELHALCQSPLWGIGRVAMNEKRYLRPVLIDLDPEKRVLNVKQLVNEILFSDGEDQIVLQNGCRYVARLVEHSQLRTTGTQFSAEETYLITGGTGGLGLIISKWLADKGVKHLMLLNRHPPSQGVTSELQKIRSRGVKVYLRQADLAVDKEIENIFSEFGTTVPRLRGLFHLAGVLDDGLIANQTFEKFSNVMAPKVKGGWALHMATRKMELDFFVLFSSASSVMGSVGQSNYASANAFLDSLAYYRHSVGLPGIAINWGPWAERGMAAELDGKRRQRIRKSGLRMIQPEDGLRILEAVMGNPLTQICAVDADWSALVSFLPKQSSKTLFSAVAEQSTLSQADQSQEVGKNSEYIRWQSQSTDQRATFLEDYLRRQVAGIIGTEVEALSLESNFLELGIDSIMITEIINQIQQDFGLSLYAREVFERPAIDQLAEYMADEMANEELIAKGLDKEEQKTAIVGNVVPPTVKNSRSPSAKRNPPMVFLLSSPRSGSTLLRVMLAGHSQLFCPPELHLLQFDDLSERRESLGNSYLTEGLERAMMELKQIGPTESKALIDDLIRQDQTTQEVYRMIQDSLDERLLIDKSPTYGADIETLARAESLFDRPKYIHLVRHPYSVIESFVRNRMDRLVGQKAEDSSRLAEQVWCDTNANIIDFCEEIDSSRHWQVQFEDLVRNPEQVMRGMSNFLEVPFEPALLKPYEGKRMTDGLHEKSIGIGDPNFLSRNSIDASLADVWKAITIGRKPGGFLRRIAKELGYGIPEEFSANLGRLEEREELII